ncbi:MAG TPA: hypothetical protein VK612_01115 [Pyrinomonadaceae bacterium]|nr:hypothetical protein [Pyrinomonadaceae bacterium]
MSYTEVKDRKPTEQSEYFLMLAAEKAIRGATSQKGLSPAELADVLHKLAAGLEGVAVGLRATYNLVAQLRSEQRMKP